MSSRNAILAAVKAAQPEAAPLPHLVAYPQLFKNPIEQFCTVLASIGGTAHRVNSYEQIIEIVNKDYSKDVRVVTTIPELKYLTVNAEEAGHALHDVELAIIKSHIAVAENSAVWVNADGLPQRVLPFICQHLAVVINEADIVPTMYEAYQKIGGQDYGFATFIAGPSKTADIEQSLVLGAHGPKTMTLFILSHEA